MIEGTVTSIFSNKYGNKTLYVLEIDGQQRDGVGETLPCKEGDLVKFDAEKKGRYWNAVEDTLEVLAEGTAKPETKSTGNTPTAKATDGKDWDEQERYNRRKQNLIAYQSARNTALVMLQLANDVGVFPSLGSKGNWDTFEALVDKVTDDVYRNTQKVFTGSGIPTCGEDAVTYSGEGEALPEEYWND